MIYNVYFNPPIEDSGGLLWRELELDGDGGAIRPSLASVSKRRKDGLWSAQTLRVIPKTGDIPKAALRAAVDYAIDQEQRTIDATQRRLAKLNVFRESIG